MILFAFLMAYPMGVGPWICYSNYLPAPLKRFGDEYYYAPISAALASESFEETPIGKLYVAYLLWWIDSGFGDPF